MSRWTHHDDPRQQRHRHHDAGLHLVARAQLSLEHDLQRPHASAVFPCRQRAIVEAVRGGENLVHRVADHQLHHGEGS